MASLSNSSISVRLLRTDCARLCSPGTIVLYLLATTHHSNSSRNIRTSVLKGIESSSFRGSKALFLASRCARDSQAASPSSLKDLTVSWLWATSYW